MRISTALLCCFAVCHGAFVATTGLFSRSPLDQGATATVRAKAADDAKIEPAVDDEGSASLLDPELAADVRATVRGDKTELEIRTPLEWGRPTFRKVRVARDETVRTADAVAVKVVAEMPGSAIVVLDEYRSTAACSHGREAFLRVISVAGSTARETFRRKVVSCQSMVELDRAAPLAWDPRAATMSVRFVAEQPPVAFRIRGDGTTSTL